MSKETLRKKVDDSLAELDEVRKAFKKAKNDKVAGRKLLKAREKAQQALQALYDAHPEEKPATKRIGIP